MDLKDLTLETAKPLEGAVFEVTLPEGRTTTLKLDEAATLDVRQRRRVRGGFMPKREPFSLYFLGDPALILPQGTYNLAGEAASFDQIFIVPVGHDEEHTEYEAVFT